MEREILNLTFYGGEDLYSDGDIEDRILEIYQSGEDPVEVLKKNDDWAMLYHMSDIRHNLLEWYDVPEGASVLEIGAGCGAITGLLCEKFERVVCIELSKRRSMINAARNKEAENLEIFVGNFEDVTMEEKFDYVTLIGVLEYSASYLKSAKPYEDMLKKVRGYLKPGGTLILAIENRLGLKYWAGATEDHTAGWFDGIEGYQGIDWVRTFSKKELKDLLCENGYKDPEFYYPIPDYKMPKCVFSEKYLPEPGNLRNVDTAFDRKRFKLFEEDLVYDSLCKEELFEEFANSFLVFAQI